MTGLAAAEPMISKRDDGWMFSFKVAGATARTRLIVSDLFLADLAVQLAGWQRDAIADLHTTNLDTPARSPTNGEKT